MPLTLAVIGYESHACQFVEQRMRRPRPRGLVPIKVGGTCMNKEQKRSAAITSCDR